MGRIVSARRACASAVFLLGCGGPRSGGACPAGVLMVSSDERDVSAVGVLPLDGQSPSLSFDTELGADPALAASGGRAFFLARDRGMVYRLDACGHATAAIATQAAGEPSADPWDVAEASDGTMWIARWASASALVTDAIGAALAKIDLTGFDVPGATFPQTSAVRVVDTPAGERAFFALERLSPVATGYASNEPGAMVAVDVRSRAVVASAPLSGRNPQALTSQAVDGAGGIYFADAGNWDDATETIAGVERFDTTNLTSSLLFDEVALGGSPTTVAVSGACGAAIVADASDVNRTSLVRFAIGSGTFAIAFGPTEGFDLRGLLFAPGELLVGDARPTAGGYPVHVFTVDADCSLVRRVDLVVPGIAPLAFAP